MKEDLGLSFLKSNNQHTKYLVLQSNSSVLFCEMISKMASLSFLVRFYGYRNIFTLNSQTDNSSEKLGNDNCSVLSSFGLSDHCLLCVVRLEVFQEKATKGQEEGKRWEGEGDER